MRDLKAIADVDAHIRSSWEKTVRFTPRDEGTIIGLPYKYTVPSPDTMFQEMYYWDTFYTNEGLLEHGLFELARGNILNLLDLVQRFGYVPNGNRTWYLVRSQPPHLSMMVRRYVETTNDTALLHETLPVLEKEYEFWMRERSTPIGLNRYGSKESDLEYQKSYDYFRKERLKHLPELDAAGALAAGKHLFAECESGWDFNPRFFGRCEDFAPVDLNALLYGMENDLTWMATQNGLTDVAARYRDAAAKRKALMDKYLWDNSQNAYFDYDFVNNQSSPIFSAAAFYPLLLGMASDAQAHGVAGHLHLLEGEGGLAACPKSAEIRAGYQWDHPNAWPCLQYAAVMGLRRYGLLDRAERIAKKYCATVVRNFSESGKLWEKYNAVDGSVRVSNEYAMPPMLGWTAGVFASFAGWVAG